MKILRTLRLGQYAKILYPVVAVIDLHDLALRAAHDTRAPAASGFPTCAIRVLLVYSRITAVCEQVSLLSVCMYVHTSAHDVTLFVAGSSTGVYYTLIGCPDFSDRCVDAVTALLSCRLVRSKREQYSINC